MTPSEIILEFLAKQPDTIRENIYGQVGMDFIDEEENISEQDFSAVMKTVLTTGSNRRNLRRAVQVSATYDHIFSRPRPIGWSEKLEAIADRTGSEILKRFALQEPLEDRHFLNASEMWRALRQSTLSAAALHEHEATLMAATAKMIPRQ